MNYLHILAKQLDAFDIDESSDIMLTAIEGQPAIVQVREGPTLSIYKQTEDLDSLKLIDKTLL